MGMVSLEPPENTEVETETGRDGSVSREENMMGPWT